MEDLDSPVYPQSLTDTELARYVYSLLADPTRKALPKDLVGELLVRFDAALDKLSTLPR